MRLLIFFGLFFFLSTARAQCGLSVVASDLNLTWDLNWTGLAVSITVSKTGVPACDYGIGISKGQSANYTRYASSGGANLNYQVYSDAGHTKTLKDVPDIGSSNDVILSTLPAGANASQTVFYYFDIPYTAATTPVMAHSGTYTDSFNINLYEGNNPLTFAGPAAATAHVNVTISVSTIIAVSLVDTGGVFQQAAVSKSVDFGNLIQGATTRFDLRLRTNSGYTVSFSSANNGKLKHSTANSFVPFTFKVNGGSLNLAGSSGAPVTGLTGTGQTAMAGLGFPIQVVIGSYGPVALQGSYSDTITITATSTE